MISRIPGCMAVLIFSLVLALVPIAAMAEEEEVLTNDAIIKMVELGIPMEIILTKIQASKCDFDTSSEALFQLMNKGVKVELIKVMIAEDAHPSKAADIAENHAVKPAGSITKRGNSDILARIAGGCFKMGNTLGGGGEDEGPVHEVCVDDFYLSKFEVTVGEYREFMNEKGYKTDAGKGDGCYHHSGKKWLKDASKNWHDVNFSQTEDDPVTCVSWYDALEFIKWRSIKDGMMYRLPTEAEWEYAARSGGLDYKYSWGNGLPSANIADKSLREFYPDVPIWEDYDDGFPFTSPVGSFEPNELGLYDMTGNVWEWVSDWYAADYYAKSPNDNPEGPSSGVSKIVRGGAWFNDPASPPNITNTYRTWLYPPIRNFYNGFRLAASVDQ